MLEVAKKRAQKESLDIEFKVGVAEQTHQADQSFDLVLAGQCWWWFDAQLAIKEVKRILKPGGRLIICSFNYIPVPGSAAHACEEVILKHNPGWSSAGNNGISQEQIWQLTCSQFEGIESYSHDQMLGFTHEDWRGRLRACNGVGASLSPEEIKGVDQDFQVRLERDFPGEISVLHRIFVATGTCASVVA
jgi:SAM-dependent methyltransferase